MSTAFSPHRDAKVLEDGPPLGSSLQAAILLHGRGGWAEEMRTLRESLGLQNWSTLTPQAAEQSWYPNSFLTPIESNQPWLSSALNLLESLVSRCTARGIPANQVAIIGFSQGACLASEFVASYTQRYKALVAFTGGLLGPMGRDLRHKGSLEGTPILLSSGDPDSHVPWRRVEESAVQFSSMGADVTLKRYPNRAHTILLEEIEMADSMLRSAG